MKKGLLLLGILLYLVPTNKILAGSKSKSVQIIENFIIEGKKDSALFYLQKEDASTLGIYYNSLLALSKADGNPNSKNFYHITSSVQTRESYNTKSLSYFLINNLSAPTNKKEPDMYYSETVWSNIVSLTNQNLMDVAIEQNTLFENYVSQFDSNLANTKIAQIYASNLHITLAGIQEDVENGVPLCKKNLRVSREINDTDLIINSIYNYTNFLIFQGKLDEFITLSEEAYHLDKGRKKRSSSHMAVMMNLIDAYMYKGGYNEQVFEILLDLHHMEVARLNTYSYMMKFLRYIEIPSEYSDSLFSLVETSNLLEFCKKTETLCEPHLNPQDQFYLLNEISLALAAHKHYDEALAYKQKCIEITQKTYSQDLAKSIAQNETNLLKQKQALEIENEQQKSQLLLIISVLAVILLLLTLTVLYQRRKKEKLLTSKNQEIILQRDSIKEKDHEKSLLLKEIHHRVKNNFQIISSLLELQAADITDEQALKVTQEGKNRINSMALIHKKLYQNDDLVMYFDDYLEKLVSDIVSTYKKEDDIKLELNLIHKAFDLDTAIPLGLIVNELITNAIKYGTGSEKPVLTLSIQEQESKNFLLTVKDNGRGIPSDLNLNALPSLGLNLVVGLAKQLQGKLEIKNDNGAVFNVSFMDTYNRSLID